MKKILVIIVALLGCLGVKAQSSHIYEPVISLPSPEDIDPNAFYVLGYKEGSSYYLHASGTGIGEMQLAKDPNFPIKYKLSYSGQDCNAQTINLDGSLLLCIDEGTVNLGGYNPSMTSYYSLVISDGNISSSAASGYTVYHDGNIIKSHTGLSEGNLRFFKYKQQNNSEIWYRSTDGQKVDPHDTDVFGATIQSNVYYPDANTGIITFESEVTSIGELAFWGCSNLASATIPNSVTSIGEGAFWNCSNLTYVTIPNSVTSIGESAFWNCSNLTYVTIPNSVTSIGGDAFRGCSNLTHVTIPNSVTSIGEGAFCDCQSLTRVEFQGSACQNAIGNDAFLFVGSQSNLIDLILPDTWEDKNLPIDDHTAWYGGYFNCARYYRPAALASITEAMDEYAETAFIQELVAAEIANINNATDAATITANLETALIKLAAAIASYEIGLNTAFGEMGTECDDCPAVDVKKGTKTIRLYNPDKVEFIKIEE